MTCKAYLLSSQNVYELLGSETIGTISISRQKKSKQSNTFKAFDAYHVELKTNANCLDLNKDVSFY